MESIKREHLYIYEAKVKKIIDGDTIDMEVNLGFGIVINARIRFRGVQAPEIFKVKRSSEEFKQGQIAKLEVTSWLFGKDKIFILKAYHRDLYGRWIGEIYKDDNKDSLNEYLKKKFYKSKYFDWFHQEPLLNKW